MVEDRAIVVRDAGLLLVKRGVDTLSDHELAGIDTRVDSFNSLVQVADNLLSGRGRDDLNLVNLTIGHFDDTMGESLKTDIVSYHDHGDFLAHVKVNQDLHDDVS